MDKTSNVLEDEHSSKSLNTHSSLSSLDKDTELIFPGKSLYPPLFVHFSCSVRKNKQEIKSCPLSSLPTCLSEYHTFFFLFNVLFFFMYNCKLSFVLLSHLTIFCAKNGFRDYYF